MRINIVLCYLICIFSCNTFKTKTPQTITVSGIGVTPFVNHISIPQSSFVIAENEKIGGWLQKKVNAETIISKLGHPIKKGVDEYWGATGTHVQEWYYDIFGIRLEMESLMKDGLKTVKSITISNPCKLATSQGVSIGTKDFIVKDKYSKYIDKIHTDSTRIVVGSVYGGIIFSIENGVVSKIFIGALAD